MSKVTLEQRIAALEQEVAALKEAVKQGLPAQDWRRAIGFFDNDPGMKEIFDIAMQLREKDRERARRRYSKKRTHSREQREEKP